MVVSLNHAKRDSIPIRISGSLLALMLIGCASPTTSPDTVRKDQSTTARVCSELPQAEAYERLKKAWERCYLGPTLSQIVLPLGVIPVPLPVAGGGASMRVEADGSVPGASLVLRTPSGKVMLVADFTSGGSCKSEVTARGWNGAWDRAAQNTAIWLENPTAAGPALNCR